MSNLLNPNRLVKTKLLKNVLDKSPNVRKSIASMPGDSEKKQKPFCTLPPLDKSVTMRAMQEPSSILTKFIYSRTKDLIKQTESNMKKPVIIPSLINDNNLIENDEINKSNDNDDNQKIKANPLLRYQSYDKSKKDRNNKIEGIYLTQSNSIRSPVITEASSPNSIQNMKEYLRNLQNNSGLPLANITSMSVSRKIRTKDSGRFANKFRRIRSYQPVILEEWKFLNGLRVNVSKNTKLNILLRGDSENQSRVIKDNYKLLVDDFTFYKDTVMNLPKYWDAFKQMSLKSKIKFNKSLEETIGILYLLPKLLLVDFYGVIQNYKNISMPVKEKFKDKYVFDELSTLQYNNSLLIEVIDFFKMCIEVYEELVKEVNGMALSDKGFSDVISCFEKARYNLCYVSNSIDNGIKNYEEDVNTIRKICSGKRGSVNLDNIETYEDKIRSQFQFKKNKAKQRQQRIENSLKDESLVGMDKKWDDFIPRKKSVEGPRKMNTIFTNDIFTKLMKYLNPKVSHEIATERINNEINGHIGEEDEPQPKDKKGGVVRRLNF